MKNKLTVAIAIVATLLTTSCKQNATRYYDVCIYGATSSGVMAAYTAKSMGKSVIIIEPSIHLGGLTSGGLGQTDIGNKYAITGLSRDFYQRIGAHYGKMEQWTFEPHVAKSIFQKYIDDAEIEIIYQSELVDLSKEGTVIKNIEVINTNTNASSIFSSKVFIDCTYEGDLMAMAGVSYTIGREANGQYGEQSNGVQLMDKHQFMDDVNPYQIPGDPNSGLLWGISDEVLAANGSADKKVQAYNYRLCLTDSIENQIPITKPVGYDSTKFELLLRYIAKKQPSELNWALMHIQPMPGRKTDINNSGPFSTDYIGANYTYPEATYSDRREIAKDHKLYTESLLYFLGNDPRVPDHLRKEMKKWGYPKDEYQTSNNFTPQLYVREARRMVSDVVMTEKHCVGEEVVEDGIALAAYTMDSHNTQRIVVNGMTKNEGDVQVGLGGLPPYPISYRSIIPKQSECSNLLVPVCLSASHIAFGSIRMEPVFMVLGQSAGVAAAMAVENNLELQNIDVKHIQKELISNPLSDGRPGLITLDNDDRNLKTSGKWEKSTTFRGRYGKSLLISDQANSSVTFSTDKLENALYESYIYFPSGERLTNKVILSITGEEKDENHEIIINNNESGWVFISELSAKKGNSYSFELKSIDNEDLTIADAIILKPKN
jgi:hypothetical protein